VTLAAAMGFLERKISVGLNGTFVSYDHSRTGSGVTGNMDVGLAVRPVPLLSFGVVGRNLLPVDKQSGRLASLASGVWISEPTIGALGFEIERKLEPVINNKPWRVGAGFESTLKVAQIRSGYRWDSPTSTHWVTAGLGAKNEAGAVEYGIAVPLMRGFGSAVHQISVRWSIRTELPAEF
jgi:hypothetical protein